MSEGRQQLLQQREIEQLTISRERALSHSSGENTFDRSGIDFQSRRSPSGVLVEAYARALPKKGGLVPEQVLREFCLFLVRFPQNFIFPHETCPSTFIFPFHCLLRDH